MPPTTRHGAAVAVPVGWRQQTLLTDDTRLNVGPPQIDFSVQPQYIYRADAAGVAAPGRFCCCSWPRL